jgi:F-type H+-transporting ATPase subunit b
VISIRLLLSMVLVLASASLALAAGGGVSDHQWSDLGARVLNFVVLAVVLVVLLKKPLGQVFRSRTQNIADELAELEAKRDEARKEFAEMERRLKDAEGEREKVLEGFREQGERERDQIIENAKKMAQRIKEQAESTIEQETAMAKSELRQEIAELSAALAEDLLKENINAEDQNRLVDEYLAKVGQEIQ